jgi:TRAP-type mannitol/chloroaromatic compound transport system substrate-binding protein
LGLGLASASITKKEEALHLKAISDFPVNLENIRKFAAKIRKPLATYTSGEIKVDGGIQNFIGFLRLFDVEE